MSDAAWLPPRPRAIADSRPRTCLSRVRSHRQDEGDWAHWLGSALGHWRDASEKWPGAPAWFWIRNALRQPVLPVWTKSLASESAHMR